MPGEPARVRHEMARIVMPKPSEIRQAVSEVEGFNAKFAVLITRGVGTMACAYLFGLIALAGLPTALEPGGEGIVAWIAQTFLQLVLLSIIMVGQTVQSAASDARAEKEFNDTEVVLDRLDEHTAGGIKTVLDRLDALEEKLSGKAVK
ncbi:MAG: hypothetical protein ACYDA6_09170 [Solirubrobacteraceae bacterium]